MPNYILNERIPLEKANFINEMIFSEFSKYCGRCENDYERRKLYNKVKKICNDIIINNGVMIREYSFSESMENYGRLSSNGMQGVMREFRGFLMGDTTTDLDQENSHPVILSYLCHKYNINCDTLDEYNNDREKVLQSFFPITRTQAKCELLKSINRDQHNKNHKHPFYKKWDKEIQQIQKQILQLPEYKVIFDTVPVDKTYNKEGSKMSRILCHHENLILQVALEVINEADIEVATLMADGCMIYGNHYENTELLEIIKTTCNEKFEGLNMNWTYKPHCEDIVIPEGWICKKAMRELEKVSKTEKQEHKRTATFKDYIPYDLSTDTDVAKFIISLYPEKFIWIKEEKEKSGVMYSWTGKKWETGNLEFIRFITSTMIDELYKIKARVDKDLTIIDGKLTSTIHSALESAEKNFKFRVKQIKFMESTEPFITSETVKFDNNADIIGFNNGVYDLITHEFRETRYSDYITMSCGYNYNDRVESQKIQEMNELIKTIIPDEETRNLMLEVMSGGLTGRVIEKFVLFNGGGRNGKGLLDEFLQLIFGDYCLIYANVSLLTEKDKTGGNPEKANLDNKRLAIMKEPDGDEPLLNANIKSFTGGGNVAGRTLYSKKTIINLCMILIMECNVRPRFKSEPGDAEDDRVVDILFPNRFTTNEEEINNINIVRGDPKFKTLEWKEDHRDAFLQILLTSFKNLQKNNYALTIPKVVAVRTQEYLNQSFPIYELFNDNYFKTGNKKDIIKLKDAYALLKNTETFCNYSKQQKLKFNYKYFCEFFQTHRSFRGDYKTKFSSYTNILIGYSRIVVEEDNDITEDC